MNKLDAEEVKHVASLAKIAVTEEEIDTYAVDLKKLLDEVDKIKYIQSRNENRWTVPTADLVKLREDQNESVVSFEEMKKNAPKTSGNYIEVPVMIHE